MGTNSHDISGLGQDNIKPYVGPPIAGDTDNTDPDTTYAEATGLDISVDYEPVNAFRGLIVKTAGNVKLQYHNGGIAVITLVASQEIRGHKIKKIFATGTTAYAAAATSGIVPFF